MILALEKFVIFTGECFALFILDRACSCSSKTFLISDVLFEGTFGLLVKVSETDVTSKNISIFILSWEYLKDECCK